MLSDFSLNNQSFVVALVLTFSVLVANPKKLPNTVANPARSWSVEQGKENLRTICLRHVPLRRSDFFIFQHISVFW